MGDCSVENKGNGIERRRAKGNEAKIMRERKEEGRRKESA